MSRRQPGSSCETTTRSVREPTRNPPNHTEILAFVTAVDVVHVDLDCAL